jgi:hypothetical protein
MRTVMVDGIEYPCPRYLVRAKCAWQVRIHGDPIKAYADRQHGGNKVRRAYHAALGHLIARLNELGRELVIDATYRAREQANKQRPTGIAGVYLIHKRARGRRKAEVELQVRLAGMPARTLYVGSASTWQRRLDAKLEQAKRIRDGMRAQRLAARPAPTLAMEQGENQRVRSFNSSLLQLTNAGSFV